MKGTIRRIIILKRGVLSFCLLISGAVLVILQILRIPFLPFNIGISDSLNTAATYFVLGLIAIALAIERAIDLYQIQESLKKQTEVTDKINEAISYQIQESLKKQTEVADEIKNAIRQLNVYESLNTKDEVYESALKLIEKAETVIRAIVFAERSKVTNAWNLKLAEILKNRDLMGKPIEFKLIICSQRKAISESLFQEARTIYNYFRERGVATKYIRYIHILEGDVGAIGPDMLIIDNGHAIINFSTLAPTSGLETHKGIQFYEQAQITKNLIEWFDKHVSHGAEKFEVVCKKYMEQIKPNASDENGACPDENCTGSCWRLDS